MTFYNVLSALLFLGGLRTLLLALEALNWPIIFASGCLTILVFNDMLSTSYQVESAQGVKYTLPLMLIDLLNFLLLAVALIVINPAKNLFDVQLTGIATFLGPPSFWLLVLIYWLMLMVWTAISKISANQKKGALWWQFSVAAVFFVEWFLHLLDFRTLIPIVNVIVFSYLALYVSVIRLLRHASSQQ